MQATLLLFLLQTCPQGNLLANRPVETNNVKGQAQTVTDGALAQEGTFWEAPAAVVLSNPQSTLTYDLGEPREIRGLVLQGDNNDVYPVEGSTDGLMFKPVWNAPVYDDGQGLRTRWTSLPKPETVRYLRVRGQGGDGFFSVSELRAYCQLPSQWPPALYKPPIKLGWSAITNDIMVGIKGATALLCGLLLLWGFQLRREGKPNAYKKLRDRSLATLGVFSFLCFWNLGHFHFDSYLHTWEHYHYYVGSKYFRELGYSRLYQCTAAADMEEGGVIRQKVVDRKIRNLETNLLESSAAIVADPTICTKHFTPARWQAFKKDVTFFRGQMWGRWDESQKDHGYNGTPVWGILGNLLTSIAPASTAQIWFLGMLDPLVLSTMWGFALWAFGWRATCVALAVWGTNFPARYWWNGGAYLRMDWLASMIIGICLLKKQKYAWGGAAITYSALLRIFPGFLVAGLIAKGLIKMWREKRFVLSPEHKKFAKGCILTIAILVPVSAGINGGMDAWGGFVANSRKHLKTPLTNNMGLKTVLNWEEATRAIHTRNYSLEDPFKTWKESRLRVFDQHKYLFFMLLAAFLYLLARALEHEEDWVAAALGVGMIPVATELTCYYYSFMLAFGLLWLRRERIGIGVCIWSAASCVLYATLGWDDDVFTGISLATIVAITYSAWQMGFAKPLVEGTKDEPQRKQGKELRPAQAVGK